MEYGGVWGKVCGAAWDRNAADTICRQLGYPAVLAAIPSALFGSAEAIPTWLEFLKCDKGAQSIEDCRTPGWGQGLTLDGRPSCDHNLEASVVCETAGSIGKV